ncbi:transcription factor UPBEAT1 [Malania oleifera]|uniref:transcription factor UPBEAT1 n=1 Tax=Malania oleifera TaxID=397392 RepID=UPI0025ADB152|nr:transcription factor UPBEAT1 [Malania oleifera]
MSLRPKSVARSSLLRTRRGVRRLTCFRRTSKARLLRRARSSFVNGGRRRSSAVSEKLEALKNLIPSHHHDRQITKPDLLFQETADYIVLLRTQVAVLQSLIHFYGSSDQKENCAV